MPLGLAQKVFNPVAVMAAFSDEHSAVVGPSVMKLRHLKHIIHLETVCIDDAIGKDLLSDNCVDACTFGILAVYTAFFVP